jgi:hypothetical protein
MTRLARRACDRCQSAGAAVDESRTLHQLNAAKTLGPNIPLPILARADEAVEKTCVILPARALSAIQPGRCQKGKASPLSPFVQPPPSAIAPLEPSKVKNGSNTASLSRVGAGLVKPNAPKSLRSASNLPLEGSEHDAG